MKLSENGIIALISSAVLIVCGIIYVVSSDEPSDNRIIIKPRSADTTQDISEEYSENKNDLTKENIVITTKKTNKSKKLLLPQIHQMSKREGQVKSHTIIQ